MKKLLLTLVILLLAIAAAKAQPPEITNITDKYAGKKGITYIKLNDPALYFTTKGNKAAAEALKNITKMVILSCSGSPLLCAPLAHDLRVMRAPWGYKDIISVDDNGSLYQIFIEKTGNKNSGFFSVTTDSESATMIWMEGEFNTADLKSLKGLLK